MDVAMSSDMNIESVIDQLRSNDICCEMNVDECDYAANKFTLRANLNNMSECKMFVSKLGAITCTKWNLLPSWSKEPIRMVVRRKWACHHSHHWKTPGSKRDTNCLASIDIKVKLVTTDTKKKDSFLRLQPPLPAVIILSLNHNHSLKSADTLRYLRVSDEVKAQFHRYFDAGMSASEAMHAHENTLMTTEDSLVALASGASNPSFNTVYYLYKRWRALNFGSSATPPLDKGLETVTKRRRIEEHIMLIGTHNGTFHCDEALACFMLKTLPEYKDATIIRTRDVSRLAECDILVDVGGVFDPSTHRYDHHQRSFVDTMKSLCPSKSWTTKLSSAGLVYVHFGRRFISEVLNLSPAGDPVTSVIGEGMISAPDAVSHTSSSCSSSSSQLVELIYDKVYENFLEEIDAVDNGIDVSDNLRYSVTTTVSSRVGYLNPPWNQPEKNTDQYLDKQFEVAMTLVGTEIVDRIKFYAEVWWPARSIVHEALMKRFEDDASGEILVLANGACPWKDHLVTLEEELKIATPIKFVLYTDSNGMWRVQCVPAERKSFNNRLSLVEAWRGLRDSELCAASGIDGSTFVHTSGFIGGNTTKKGAMEMARVTLRTAANKN